MLVTEQAVVGSLILFEHLGTQLNKQQLGQSLLQQGHVHDQHMSVA